MATQGPAEASARHRPLLREPGSQLPLISRQLVRLAVPFGHWLNTGEFGFSDRARMKAVSAW